MLQPKLNKSFEEYLDIIDVEIAKRRNKWNLSSLTWMDFDDVSQIIRIHIYKKWNQFDQNKPIQPWLNTIISNQIKNIIRNIYSNYARPCLKCEASIESTGCKIYKEQCSACPLFAYWKKRKEPANHIKIPVSIENHAQEVYSIKEDSTDIMAQISALHKKMKQILKPIEYQIYEGLFILNLDERGVAEKLGYISNEKGRNPGYKQIKNIRKIIIVKVKKCLEEDDLDVY